MTVLLVDDHPLFLEGIRNLLSARGIEVVGTARDGRDAVDRARALRPDLVLMDVQMPRMDGLAALRLIKAELPETRVVMVTMSADDEHLFEAIRCGASGYLLKTQDTDEFFAILDEVERGEIALSPGLATRVLQEFRKDGALAQRARIDPAAATLSPREVEVLTLVARALTYKEVGSRLFVSERTVKYHMGEIIRRLHVASRSDAVEYARRSGLVP